LKSSKKRKEEKGRRRKRIPGVGEVVDSDGEEGNAATQAKEEGDLPPL
jgi:hypothetical protein